MNKLLLLCMAISMSMIALAQSNFDKGFQVGYKEGYCHLKTGCIAPIPPISPIPGVNENINSYMDGYNRGFVLGYNSQNSSSTNINRKESQLNQTATPQKERQRFQTSTAKNVDFMYNPILSTEDVKYVESMSKLLYNVKGKAVEYLDIEDYYSAIRISKEGLSVSPYDAEFMMLIGEGYRQLGEDKKAIRYLTKAYNKNRNSGILKIINAIKNGTDDRSIKIH